MGFKIKYIFAYESIPSCMFYPIGGKEIKSLNLFFLTYNPYKQTHGKVVVYLVYD